MEKVNNHINPRVYLRQFTIDKNKNRTYALIKNNVSTIKEVGIGDVCNSKNYYVYKDVKNNRITEIEDWFSEFENNIMKVTLDEVLSKYNLFVNDGELILSNECRCRLIEIVLSQIVRGYEARKHNQGVGKAILKKKIKEIKKFERMHPSEKRRRQINMIQKSTKQLLDETIKRASSMQTSNHEVLFKSLSNRNCALLFNATNTPFVTSDEPVLVLGENLEESGLFVAHMDEAKVYYPISPKIMLFFLPKSLSAFGNAVNNRCYWLKESDKEFILALNYYHYHFANKHVISNSQNALQKIIDMHQGANSQ